MSQLHHYFFCPCCTVPNVFHHYPALFAHIRDEHRDEPFFSIRCELSVSCGSRYSSFESYRCHIYRSHRTLIESFDNSEVFGHIDDLFSGLIFNDELQGADHPESCIYPDEEPDETDCLFSNFDFTSVSSNDHENDTDQLVRFYTFFLLQLREQHLLPQKVVQIISSNICKLLDMIIKVMKAKSASFTSITDCESIVDHITSMINSISKNEYQFVKQCKKYFDYQAPTEIILDSNDRFAYYVPLQQSFSHTLQNGQLLQTIIDNIQCLESRVAQDKDLLLSNRQSHFIRTKLQRQTNPNTLLLKLYTDGISITNPIGPSKDCHKLTCFYYLLDDLPEVIRSQVNSIGLHCICYTKHLNTDKGREILMNVLVEDLNRLQKDGVTIPCLSSRIYFAFSFICGDNLASNEIGGFQKTFSSGSFCRHCFITYEQKHIPLSDISFLPRTPSRHDMIVNQVAMNNDDRIIQGVRGLSWFNELIGFHATESLPPDLMHDFQEGVLLKEIIQQRLLTYAEIEERISSFTYGFYDTSNKPPSVKKQNIKYSNIAGSASQRLCLFRLFPLIFHEYIDDLSLFPVFTLLREILSYVYANPIRNSWLPYLDGLCKEFYSLMIELLPDYVTPKCHFITEYARSIEKHGLPILNSCIRFESKHQYFKQLANRSFNFRNPLLTLMKRPQFRHCMLNTAQLSAYSCLTMIRSSKTIDFSKLSIGVQRLLADYTEET
ncbi:unnamed protein product [Adineta ricciae]|uniref:C2H2-type domain-containing protein n=1 Tax=Adineta ricciae TaxID=249248 RepID=A0A815I3D9_ADIRI|nr:unnamed protein product [Adineta ricciae]